MTPPNPFWEMNILATNRKGMEFSFRMGFTSIGSLTTNWSHEVKRRVFTPTK
jgi:hypothetical protein